MGEYAKRRSDGQSVKIGTCEDMYYLRAGQRWDVTPEPGNLNPAGPEAYALRFRFPWPDEDGVPPGGNQYHDNGYHRSLPIPGIAAPSSATIDHNALQFSHRAGYLVSLPCPEGIPGAEQTERTTVNGLTIIRNGFSGSVRLVAQKLLRDGRLVPVLQCGACGAMWREEQPDAIMTLVLAMRRAGGADPADARQYHQVADRVLEGANMAPSPVTP